MAKIERKIVKKHTLLVVSLAPAEVLKLAYVLHPKRVKVEDAFVSAVWHWLTQKGLEYMDGLSLSFANVSWIENGTPHYEVTFYPLAYAGEIKEKMDEVI